MTRPTFSLLHHTHGGALDAAGVTIGDGIDLLDTLCERFPRRPTGSTAERDCLAHLTHVLRDVGITDITTDPVRCISTDYQVCELRIGDARGDLIESQPVLFTGQTTDAGITGPLVYVDDIEQLDFTRADLRGCVLLVYDNFGEYGTTRYYRAVCEAHVAAVVIIRNMEFATLMALPTAAAVIGDVPVASISHREGMSLLKSGNTYAHLRVRRTIHDAVGRNFVARLPAIGKPIDDRVILITAHHDTNPLAPNAADNTVGVAMAIEVMRTLARAPQRGRDVYLASYTAEEFAFEGSLQFPHDHGDLTARCAAQLYYDGHGTAVGRNELFVNGDDSLVSFLQQAARDIHHPMETHRSQITLDPIVLMACGIPAVRLGRRPQRTWHTRYDHPHDIAPQATRAGIHHYAEATCRAINADVLPFSTELAQTFRDAGTRRCAVWTPRTLDELRQGVADGLAP